MDLTNKSISQRESSIGNILTIGSTAGRPTTGTLQNGAGKDVTSLTLDELQVNRLVQTQATIAANGTTLSSATLLSAGVNLVTSADSSNIAVKLPDSQLGLTVNVVNTSSRDIEVFPFAATHSLVGLSAGAAFTVPADNQLYQFVCVQNPVVGVWSVVTPTSNSSVRRSVSVNLVADGTHIGLNQLSDASFSAPNFFGSQTTVNPSTGSYNILNAPSSPQLWFDSPEFNTYNKVRIVKMVAKTNVPAGDLTSAASQQPSALTGLNEYQMASMQGYVRVVSIGGSGTLTTVANINEFSGLYPAVNYSAIIDGGGGQTLQNNFGLSHYMKNGTLYQQIEAVPTNYGVYQPIRDANGNQRIYFSPFISYGSGGNPPYYSPYSGFPSGFSFEAELIVDFEFSM